MDVKLIKTAVKNAITDVRALDALTPTERGALVHQGVISYNPLKRRYRVTLKGRTAVYADQFDSCAECGQLIVIVTNDQPSSCPCA